MTTIRATMAHYARFGDSDAHPHEVGCAKTGAPYRQINHISETTYDRLCIANKVAKAVDALCDKGNQLDSIYDTYGDSAYRTTAMVNMGYRGDMLRNGVYSGNCGQLKEFAEHILAAINSERYNRNKVDGGYRQLHPITLMSWDQDHGFPVLGDSRSEPVEKLVTVDGWVMRPAAHTMDKTAFTGSFRSQSSTLSESRDYLDSVVAKRSLASIEREYGGRSRTPWEREHWTDQIEDSIYNGMPIWDVQFSDRQRETVQYYQPPGRPPISFDFMPHAELDQKIDTHSGALAQGIDTNVRR
ncbi:hypothetical protein ACKC9G_12465 [Pokkaliibacter sp. CJK22405]|uniref:hypothetical protein n=1 Tax=Pokkaliibacter sp. CJK22405 TaxID=3384615 RepID=UPI003984BD85